ncbi:MAG: septum formation initiator family protein, partial [Opitutales bacterium]|nr:septum formation initiator family protein [Opitutales bacterium]
MSKSDSGKGLLWIAALALCAAAAAYFTTSAYGIFCERRQMREKARSLELAAENLKNDNAYKREYLNRLENDPEFAKRVVRETLGYVGEREIVFKFDSKFSPKNAGGVGVETF